MRTNHLKYLSFYIIIFVAFICNSSVRAEDLLFKYDFTNGSKLPTSKFSEIYTGNEFGVFNTTTTPFEMILQSGVDYLTVKNSATAVDQKRYGYISIGAQEGYSFIITRVEINSQKGNSNTLNARCYLYDSLKNSPTILSNMIYTGSNASSPIPETWETKSFVPLAGPQTINDTVIFSFTSTQSVGSGVPAEWNIDQIAFYGTISGGNEVIYDFNINVDVTKPQHVISKLLNGSHFVYGSENDQLYKDERISNWMKDTKVGIIRWPGGTTVMSYHWDALTGDNFGPDRWDTQNYVENNISASNYMDLDEYIAYCQKVKAEPMVGVNIRSGKFYKTDAEGLAEARRLIQYCVDKNYKVKHWYIGNESYAKGFGASSYAQYIDLYANELKKVDPTITIVGDWKFGPESSGRYNELLSLIQGSSQIDVMEVHEKWGNEWGVVSGLTLADWKNEFPLYNGKLDDYCKKFKTDVTNLGKSTKLSMNEWGIGGMVDGTDYHYALLAADYMTQMFKNDIYSACYWNLNMGTGKSKIFLTKNNSQDFDRFNPVSNVFKQFAPMLGCNFLELNSSNQQVYGVASINPTKDTVQVLILNKSANKSKINIRFNGFITNNTVINEWFNESGMVKKEEIATGNMSYILPEYSFTRLQFTGNSTTAITQPSFPEPEMTIINYNKILNIILPNNDLIKTACVYDLCGGVIEKIKFSGSNNQLNLNDLYKGIYCLHVTGLKSNYVKKIIL